MRDVNEWRSNCFGKDESRGDAEGFTQEPCTNTYQEKSSLTVIQWVTTNGWVRSWISDGMETSLPIFIAVSSLVLEVEVIVECGGKVTNFNVSFKDITVLH